MQHCSRSLRAYPIGIIGFLALRLAGCGALVTPSPPVQATASTVVVKPYSTPDSTHVLYSNALTAPAPGWVSGPECSFTSSGLVVRPNRGLAYICLAPTSPLTDVSVMVSVRQISGPLTHAYGIVFRHTAPKNYFFFGIDGRGRFTFTVVINDVSHIIIPFTPKAAIHTGAGATNQLQVIARGQVITLLVNDTAVGQVTISTFARGTVGLRGINDGEVVFRQLSIARV
jgi:hypothetical protein